MALPELPAINVSLLLLLLLLVLLRLDCVQVEEDSDFCRTPAAFGRPFLARRAFFIWPSFSNEMTLCIVSYCFSASSNSE